MDMITITKKEYGQLSRNLKVLRHEVREIKQFLLFPLKDAEGDYQHSFIKKMLGRSQSQDPFYTFTGKDSFLAHVRSGK